MFKKKYNFLISALALLAFFELSLGAHFKLIGATQYSLNDIFDQYGFVTEEAKDGLKGLLKNASISLSKDPSPKEKLAGDLENASTSSKTPSPEDFSKKESADKILEKVVSLVEETQKKFTVRKDHQERWQVSPLDWMKLPDNQEHLQKLGFVNEVLPQSFSPDAICILGATRRRMKDRIRYVKTLLKAKKLQAKHFILLSGERYVDVIADGPEEKLKKIAEMFHIKDLKDLTEMHVMQYLYERSSFLKDKYPIPDIINVLGVIPSANSSKPEAAEPNKKQRPTTESTINALIEQLQRNQEIQSVLFISNQPYIAYQKAIIQLSFKIHHMDHIQIEVIGDKVEDPSKVQPLIEGLGSYLWAGFPAILANMYVTVSDDIKERLDRLYSKSSLMDSAISLAKNQSIKRKFGYKWE